MALTRGAIRKGQNSRGDFGGGLAQDGSFAGAGGWPVATRARRLRLVLSGVVLAVALSGCIAQTRNHGYIPPDADMAALTIGTDTRESVVASVGAPTSGGLMGGGNFYYVQSSFRHYGPFAPEETDRQVLVMTFTESGVLANIERFGLADGQVVLLSRRVTDSGLRDTTFLRQLLGNLGNFDASTLIGED